MNRQRRAAGSIRRRKIHGGLAIDGDVSCNRLCIGAAGAGYGERYSISAGREVSSRRILKRGSSTVAEVPAIRADVAGGGAGVLHYERRAAGKGCGGEVGGLRFYKSWRKKQAIKKTA